MMRKSLLLVLAVFVASLFLAGCNKEEEPEVKLEPKDSKHTMATPMGAGGGAPPKAGASNSAAGSQ